MKHKVWLHHLISAVFSFVLSVSAIGNLVTGFGLPVDSLWEIYLWCGIFAALTSLLFRFRYGGRILLLLSGLVLFGLWRGETAWHQTWYLSYIITSHYHLVYDWPILGGTGETGLMFPLVIWAGLTAIGVNWHICRRKHILIAMLPVVIPLVLCLITTDHVPEGIYLYLTVLGLAVLLLTQWTRKHHPAQGFRLILRCVIPVAAALALVFALNPREEYVNRAGKLQKEALAWFEELLDTTEAVVDGTPVTSLAGQRINLQAVGPKSRLSRSVMLVNSPLNGALYLRGRDYDRYTGIGWESSPQRNESFPNGGDSAGELKIITYSVRNVLYVPYYATERISLTGGVLENRDSLRLYSYGLSAEAAGISEFSVSGYLDLPADTLQWASELAGEITGGAASREQAIQAIRNYVRDSAVYDLSTNRMDAQSVDFAKWFLEESDTGYCVHFATAATVLLRAAGIPARYVEGYMIACVAGRDVTVSNQDAHAWVEYFDSNTGIWHVLEATPSGSEAETEPAPATETVPSEAMEETNPTGTETNSPEQIPSSPQPEKPGDTQPQDNIQEPKKAPDWLLPLLNWLILGACVPLQAYLRIRWKRTWWNRGRPNERTVTRWRQTCRDARLLNQPYPEALDNLAQKAKFSQHRIQPEELEQFADYQHSLAEAVDRMPWYQKLWFKWIMAVDCGNG